MKDIPDLQTRLNAHSQTLETIVNGVKQLVSSINAKVGESLQLRFDDLEDPDFAHTAIKVHDISQKTICNYLLQCSLVAQYVPSDEHSFLSFPTTYTKPLMDTDLTLVGHTSSSMYDRCHTCDCAHPSTSSFVLLLVCMQVRTGVDPTSRSYTS